MELTEYIYSRPPPADEFKNEQPQEVPNEESKQQINAEPADKPRKADGSLERVNPQVLIAAKDVEAWIAARKKFWPTKARIAEKAAEEALKPPAAPEVTKDAAKLPSSQKPAATQGKRVCRYFVKGRCNNGANCRFLHPEPKANQPKQNTIYKRYEAPVKSSLFLKLVQNDHDAEDYAVLDFIEELVRQGHISNTKPDQTA